MSFPVIPEDSKARGNRPTPATPAPPKPEPEPIVPPAWEWPDDDDEEEPRREDVVDEGLEILEDEDGLEILDEGALIVPDPYERSSNQRPGKQPGRAAGRPVARLE